MIPPQVFRIAEQLEATGRGAQAPEVLEKYRTEGLETSAAPDRWLRLSEAIERPQEGFVILMNTKQDGQRV